MKSKTLRINLVVAIAAILISACSTTVAVSPTKVPPGQAKKMTGSQSAKQFAPGQQKKKK